MAATMRRRKKGKKRHTEVADLEIVYGCPIFKSLEIFSYLVIFMGVHSIFFLKNIAYKLNSYFSWC